MFPGFVCSLGGRYQSGIGSDACALCVSWCLFMIPSIFRFNSRLLACVYGQRRMCSAVSMLFIRMGSMGYCELFDLVVRGMGCVVCLVVGSFGVPMLLRTCVVLWIVAQSRSGPDFSISHAVTLYLGLQCCEGASECDLS